MTTIQDTGLHAGETGNPRRAAALDNAGPAGRVLPVNWIRNGVCSCRDGAACKHPGKHPIHVGWPGVATTAGADIYEWWEVWPDANVGIATDRASGIWTFDTDPDKGGAASFAALTRGHRWPVTRRHGTGSGGDHNLFECPPDFDVPTTSGKLFGPGIDTIGEGGFIVVPPSVSGKGPYVVRDSHAPVAAPELLLRPLREYAARKADAAAVPPAQGEPVDLAAVPDKFRQLLGRIIHQGEGDRSTHFYAIVAEARRSGYTQGQAITLVTPWCQATGKYMERGAGRVGGQVAACWGKLEADERGLRFPVPPAPQTDAAQSDLAAALAAGQVPAAAQLAPAAPDPRPAVPRLDQLRAALLTSDSLDRLPVPEPLIEGLLSRDSLAWLQGKPGQGKSLLSLDWACCIAAGLPWIGRKVTRGPVLYVIAEGATGLRPRVRAWESRAGVRTGVTFLPVAVQMLKQADVDAVTALAAEMQCALVVLDTQARVTVGADENSALDMGRMIDAAEQIRAASRACVQFVHHETRGAENMRGSTALEGAGTTILRVVKDGSRLTLTNPKQKDAPEAAPQSLWVVPHLESVIVAAQPDGPTLDLRAASEAAILRAMLDLFRTSGASVTMLMQAVDIPKSTFHWARERLVRDGLIADEGTRRRSCYVLTEAGLATEVQQVQVGPSPIGPMSNGTTNGTTRSSAVGPPLLDHGQVQQETPPQSLLQRPCARCQDRIFSTGPEDTLCAACQAAKAS